MTEYQPLVRLMQRTAFSLVQKSVFRECEGVHKLYKDIVPKGPRMYEWSKVDPMCLSINISRQDANGEQLLTPFVRKTLLAINVYILVIILEN